jgi:hypothetical protein
MMRILAVLLLLAVPACASSGPTPAPGPATQTVRIVDSTGRVVQLAVDPRGTAGTTPLEMSVEEAWRSLLRAYDAIGLSITSMDSRAHSVTSNMRVRSRLGGTRLSQYLDCGRSQGGPSADTYDVHMEVQSQVVRTDDAASRISTHIEATARPATLTGAPIRCASTGTLERRLVHEIHLHWRQVGP